MEQIELPEKPTDLLVDDDLEELLEAAPRDVLIGALKSAVLDYTALCACIRIHPEDALRLVEERGFLCWIRAFWDGPRCEPDMAPPGRGAGAAGRGRERPAGAVRLAGCAHGRRPRPRNSQASRARAPRVPAA